MIRMRGEVVRLRRRRAIRVRGLRRRRVRRPRSRIRRTRAVAACCSCVYEVVRTACQRESLHYSDSSPRKLLCEAGPAKTLWFGRSGSCWVREDPNSGPTRLLCRATCGRLSTCSNCPYSRHPRRPSGCDWSSAPPPVGWSVNDKGKVSSRVKAYTRQMPSSSPVRATF